VRRGGTDTAAARMQVLQLGCVRLQPG
jgi:hypothetical protein